MCVRCREQQKRATWQSRGMLLPDYVKHSHSPEVAALLWKLKASQRFTFFVRRRLSHSHSGPALTRYTLHGRLLWTTTTTTFSAGMSICLHEEKEWEEGWGVAEKRGTERGKTGCWFRFKLAVTDEIWLSEALYSRLLMAAQTDHLTLILRSFSPKTSLRQISHSSSDPFSHNPLHLFNLSLTTFYAPHLHTMCETCYQFISAKTT